MEELENEDLETYEVVETEDNLLEDESFDTVDCFILGFFGLIILLLVVKLCFKKFNFKISKSGLEFSSDNTKSETKDEDKKN